MDSQAFASQQSGFQQPINSIATTAETAYAGEKSQEQKKARFTRAERRAFTKEKKAAQKPAQKTKSSQMKDRKALPKNVNSVDDVIAYLLTIRGKERDRKVRESLNHVTKTLEGRISRDAPTQAGPSAKKLEKIQKRKEIRAEKRKTRLAQRAEHKATQGDESQAAGAASSSQPQETEINFDDINFDD